MSGSEVYTWRMLRDRLKLLTDKQLDMPVQAVVPSRDRRSTFPLLPVVAIETVDQLHIYACRSSFDNRRNGKELIILLDENPFQQNGAIAYEADASGRHTAVFGLQGPTSPESQRQDGYSDSARERPHYLSLITNYRLRFVDRNMGEAGS